MAVIVHVALKGLSKEAFDAVRAEAGWLERAPEGGRTHVTWWEGDTCHNIDGWDSEAAYGAFAEGRLGPAMAKLGIAIEPQVTFHPAHEIYAPAAVTLT